MTITSVVAIDMAYLAPTNTTPAELHSAIMTANQPIVEMDELNELRVGLSVSTNIMTEVPGAATVYQMTMAMQSEICQSDGPPVCIVSEANARRRLQEEELAIEFTSTQLLDPNVTEKIEPPKPDPVNMLRELEARGADMGNSSLNFSVLDSAAQATVTAFLEAAGDSEAAATAIRTQQNMLAPLATMLEVPLEAFSFIVTPRGIAPPTMPPPSPLPLPPGMKSPSSLSVQPPPSPPPGPSVAAQDTSPSSSQPSTLSSMPPPPPLTSPSPRGVPAPSGDDDSGSDSGSVPMIAGGAAFTVLFAIVVVCCVRLCRRKKHGAPMSPRTRVGVVSVDYKADASSSSLRKPSPDGDDKQSGSANSSKRASPAGQRKPKPLVKQLTPDGTLKKGLTIQPSVEDLSDDETNSMSDSFSVSSRIISPSLSASRVSAQTTPHPRDFVHEEDPPSVSQTVARKSSPMQSGSSAAAAIRNRQQPPRPLVKQLTPDITTDLSVEALEDISDDDESVASSSFSYSPDVMSPRFVTPVVPKEEVESRLALELAREREERGPKRTKEKRSDAQPSHTAAAAPKPQSPVSRNNFVADESVGSSSVSLDVNALTALAQSVYSRPSSKGTQAQYSSSRPSSTGSSRMSSKEYAASRRKTSSQS